MKKLASIILALVLLCTCLTACSSREKVDISGAKNISELKGAIIAAQSDTFHLTALDQIKDDITIKEYPDFTDLLIHRLFGQKGWELPEELPVLPYERAAYAVTLEELQARVKT